jgi:hypothetical protein
VRVIAAILMLIYLDDGYTTLMTVGNAFEDTGLKFKCVKEKIKSTVLDVVAHYS